MESLIGILHHIVFKNEANGFMVGRLHCPKHEDPIVIVGQLDGAQIGETIRCQGKWSHHRKFGKQFLIDSFESTLPEDVVGIQKYLESGLIKGIGPIYAKKIVETYKEKTLEILEKEPYRLLGIPGIGKKKIVQIQRCWQDQASIRNLMIFLKQHGVQTSLAQKIFKKYGIESITKIKENPYQIAKEIFGVGFKTADDLATKVGIPKDSMIRIEAAILHFLWELSLEGHVCYPKEELSTLLSEKLSVDEFLVQTGIEKLDQTGEITLSPLLDGKVYVWLKNLYLNELSIARRLARLQEYPFNLRSIDLQKVIPWVEMRMGLKLEELQKEAIRLALTEKLLIITGGPGTGKSTITKAILEILSKLTDKIILAAPTGRAAKRLSEITHWKASTIHSLLEMDFQKGSFRRNDKNPLECDLLIIDEASMLDTQLMGSLIRAVPLNSRLILIGDIDQLPSVGPGNVLRDLIESKKVPIARLTQIFRQAKHSKIVLNAHRINQGMFPYIQHEKKSDFVFFDLENQDQIVEKMLDLIQTHIPQRLGFHPVNDIQILSPMKRGILGTENLNHVLQQKLNPNPTQIERFGRCFRYNDKVMQIRNNYQKQIYNGDVGFIIEINQEEEQVTVNFDGNCITYDFAELDELILAYAVSIHKYQGSECPCVIIPITMSHFKLLFRNLLYTGITRGKKLVVLLGSKKAIAMCVKNDHVQKRYSGLKDITQETLTNNVPR